MHALQRQIPVEKVFCSIICHVRNFLWVQIIPNNAAFFWQQQQQDCQVVCSHVTSEKCLIGWVPPVPTAVSSMSTSQLRAPKLVGRSEARSTQAEGVNQEVTRGSNTWDDLLGKYDFISRSSLLSITDWWT